MSTTREGVAREAPKNIPPKRLLMVSTSRFLTNVEIIVDAFQAESNVCRARLLARYLGCCSGWRGGQGQAPPLKVSLCCHCPPILLNPRLSTTHLVVMLRRSLFHPRGTDASQRDNGGYTGLHYAARSGHLHVVRLLLQVSQCLSPLWLVRAPWWF